jgi:MFS family permease
MDTHMLSLVAGLVFGGAAGLLATRKGRRPHVWFGIGVLFGLIGFLVLVFMPTIEDAAAGAADPALTATMSCPYCTARIPAQALVCSHCEHTLARAA